MLRYGRIDIIITKTKEYYSSIEESLLCDCSYCRCYREQVRTEYLEVVEYLDSLGIDIVYYDEIEFGR